MNVKSETLLKLSLLLICACGLSALDFNYHNHDSITEILKNFTVKYPKISPKMHSIGKSVHNRSLWVVEVTAAPESKRGIPNVKLIGNIHGNEPVGRELLLHFLELLGANYGSDSTISWLLENTRIHVLPSMNPDGFERSNEDRCSGEHGRDNANRVDLNRDFPDFFSKNRLPLQPEVASVQKWMKQIPFILSAGLHGGSLVANYPFDTVKEKKWEKLLRQLMATDDPEEQQRLRDHYIASYQTNPPSVTADDDVFVHLAKMYANSHPTMHLALQCPNSDKTFVGGITNGAAWYSFSGGMADYNYFAHGCMELTLEISCCKYPPARELPKLWEDNKMALLNFVKQAHMGVTGRIYDYQTGKPISSAILQVNGRNMNFTTSSSGEFWRILLPGTYQLQVRAAGYHEQIVTFSVLDHRDAQPKSTKLEIALRNSSLPQSTATPSTQPISSSTTSKLTTEQYFGNKTDGSGNRPKEIHQQWKKHTPVSLSDTDLDSLTFAVISAETRGKFNAVLLATLCAFTLLSFKLISGFR